MTWGKHLLTASVMNLTLTSWHTAMHASCRVHNVHYLSRHVHLPLASLGKLQRRAVFAATQATTETSRRRVRADGDDKQLDGDADKSVIGEAARRLGELPLLSCACPTLKLTPKEEGTPGMQYMLCCS